MEKQKEIADPESCLGRSKDDEPIFVLCARDVIAPGLVREWARYAKARGVNDEKIRTAFKLADDMERWQDVNGSKLPD